MLPAIPAPRQQVAEVLLTGVKLPVPARWASQPGHQSPSASAGLHADHRLGRCFQYVWHRDDGFMVYDKEAKKWDFRPNLLEKMTKAGFFNPQLLNRSPFGRQARSDDLARLEKSFTPTHWRTHHRSAHSASGRAAWPTSPRPEGTVLPERSPGNCPKIVLAEMVKQQRYEPVCSRTPGASLSRLVKRDKKSEVNPFGSGLRHLRDRLRRPGRQVQHHRRPDLRRPQELQQTAGWPTSGGCRKANGPVS